MRGPLEHLAAASRSSVTLPATLVAEDILASLGDTVVVIEASGELLYTSAGWHHLRGNVTRGDTHGTARDGHGGMSMEPPASLMAALHPADLAQWQALVHHLSISAHPGVWRLRILGQDNHYRWCDVRSQRSATKGPWPATLLLCDVTEQVQREQIHAASLRSLTQLTSGLPGMLYRALNNRHWSMEYVSEGCLGLTGLSAEALLNHPPLSYGDIIHPEDADRVWDKVQQALQAHAPFTLRYRIRHLTGTLVHVQEKGHGIYSPDGTPLAVEGIIFAVEEET
ncbi:PAS domain-containing protein [Cobetia sp. L2A1]|uniref:PAS domain-containing protein n=1 Tax=Cobetia sp. L2A1 TaxID=2686360 RepID=UPI00131D8A87|nr:PAS domain-containing protein [Cobetia sp. L2A1]